MINCSKCNSESVLKQGIKKETGKPWSGYFCQNKECKNVDWIPKASSEAKNGRPDGFQVIGESLYRIEKKLDLLLEQKETILPEVKKEEIPVIEDEISVKDIPF